MKITSHIRWDDDDIRFLLDQHAYNCWIFIVLAHWNNSPRADMSFHMDTLFWFQSNQSLLLLFHAADTNFIVLGLAIEAWTHDLSHSMWGR
jgi:hypothetical protein